MSDLKAQGSIVLLQTWTQLRRKYASNDEVLHDVEEFCEFRSMFKLGLLLY